MPTMVTGEDRCIFLRRGCFNEAADLKGAGERRLLLTQDQSESVDQESFFGKRSASPNFLPDVVDGSPIRQLVHTIQDKHLGDVSWFQARSKEPVTIVDYGESNLEIKSVGALGIRTKAHGPGKRIDKRKIVFDPVHRLL